MKLLIVTQKADPADPILGFFHRWILAFAARVDSLTVIAQQAVDPSLPGNVMLHSLGKEDHLPLWRQITRFWGILWSERAHYDRVLVHMTPIWVILGWPLWFLLRKRVYLWYEIRRGSWRLTLALLLARKVFSATPQGLPFPHRKQVVTGHGIDVDLFRPDPARREPGRIIAVGRITRSKRYDVILRAFSELPSACRLTIAGGIVTPADETEWERLQKQIMDLQLAGRVAVHWMEPGDMPRWYARADAMLHACVGGLDKAVLEAMACGCPVVSSSGAAQGVLPAELQAVAETMGARARRVISLPESARRDLSATLRSRVVEGHGLSTLIERLVREMI